MRIVTSSTRWWRLLGFMLAALMAGCSSGVEASPTSLGTAGAPSSAASQAPTSSAAAVPPSVAPSRTPGPGDVVYDGRIAVDGTRKLEVRCVGTGTPTILLEGGGIESQRSQYPNAWVNELGKHTTVCHYSRAGGGMSSPFDGPPTMAATVADAYHLLDALKAQANVSGPYLFVGWSFGGTVALADALEHPDQTAGLVILDTDFLEDFWKACRAKGRSAAECQAEYDGDKDAKSMETELVGKVKPLPGIPIKIISAMVWPECEAAGGSFSYNGLTADDCPTLAALVAKKQLEGWGTLGSQVTQTLVDASHDGLIDQAGDRIATVILGALDETR